MTTQTVTAHIPKELVARVDAMAALEDRPRGWVVKQALADWVDMAEERHQLTLQALESVHAGMGVPHSEMAAWANSLSTDNPLPLPQARKIR
jgi:predicted transcriptional regulator